MYKLCGYCVFVSSQQQNVLSHKSVVFSIQLQGCIWRGGGGKGQKGAIINRENCTNQALFISSAMQGIVGAIAFIFLFVIAILFCCFACKYRETRITICRTLILPRFFVGFVVTYILMLLLVGIVTYAAPKGNWYILWYVFAAMLPVFQLMFTLGFLFYLYSFNLFHWRAIRRAGAEWGCFRSCCERGDVPRVGQIQEAATAPGSHHVTAPTITFFNVLHSRVTTDVPNEQQALLPDGGGDTGYSTVMNS